MRNPDSDRTESRMRIHYRLPKCITYMWHKLGVSNSYQHIAIIEIKGENLMILGFERTES